MAHIRLESPKTPSTDELFKLVDGGAEKKRLFASFWKKPIIGKRAAKKDLERKYEHHRLEGPSYSFDSEDGDHMVHNGDPDFDGWNEDTRDDNNTGFDDATERPDEGQRESASFPPLPPAGIPTQHAGPVQLSPLRQRRQLNPTVVLARTKKKAATTKPKDFSLTQMISQSFDSESGSHGSGIPRNHSHDDSEQLCGGQDSVAFGQHAEYAQLTPSGEMTKVESAFVRAPSPSSQWSEEEAHEQMPKEHADRITTPRASDEKKPAEIVVSRSLEDASSGQNVIDSSIASFKDRLKFYKSQSDRKLSPWETKGVEHAVAGGMAQSQSIQKTAIYGSEQPRLSMGSNASSQIEPRSSFTGNRQVSISSGGRVSSTKVQECDVKHDAPCTGHDTDKNNISVLERVKKFHSKLDSSEHWALDQKTGSIVPKKSSAKAREYAAADGEHGATSPVAKRKSNDKKSFQDGAESDPRVATKHWGRSPFVKNKVPSLAERKASLLGRGSIESSNYHDPALEDEEYDRKENKKHSGNNLQPQRERTSVTMKLKSSFLSGVTTSDANNAHGDAGISNPLSPCSLKRRKSNKLQSPSKKSDRRVSSIASIFEPGQPEETEDEAVPNSAAFIEEAKRKLKPRASVMNRRDSSHAKKEAKLDNNKPNRDSDVSRKAEPALKLKGAVHEPPEKVASLRERKMSLGLEPTAQKKALLNAATAREKLPETDILTSTVKPLNNRASTNAEKMDETRPEAKGSISEAVVADEKSEGAVMTVKERMQALRLSLNQSRHSQSETNDVQKSTSKPLDDNVSSLNTSMHAAADEPSLTSTRLAALCQNDSASSEHPLYVTINTTLQDCFSPVPMIDRKVVCDPSDAGTSYFKKLASKSTSQSSPDALPPISNQVPPNGLDSRVQAGLKDISPRKSVKSMKTPPRPTKHEDEKDTVQTYLEVKSRFSKKSLPWRQQNAAGRYLERKRVEPGSVCSEVMETETKETEESSQLVVDTTSDQFCPISKSPFPANLSTDDLAAVTPSCQTNSHVQASPFGTPAEGYSYGN